MELEGWTKPNSNHSKPLHTELLKLIFIMKQFTNILTAGQDLGLAVNHWY